MTVEKFRWKADRERDGSLVFRLRRSFPQVEALAARALQTEEELHAEVIRLAGRPLDDPLDEQEPPGRVADEAAVHRLALDVAEEAERKGRTFVVDLQKRAVFGPTGRRVAGGWAIFQDYCRQRIRPGRPGEGAFIENHAGTIRVCP